MSILLFVFYLKNKNKNKRLVICESHASVLKQMASWQQMSPKKSNGYLVNVDTD